MESSEKQKSQRQIDYEVIGRKIREAILMDAEIKELRERLKSLLINFSVHGLIDGELKPFFPDKKVQDEYDDTIRLIEQRHEDIKNQIFKDYD